MTVLCILLAACSAAASAPDSSHNPIVEGVGVLPASGPELTVPSTDAEAPRSTITTTTLPLDQQIGASVAGNRLLMIGDSITASTAQRYGGEMCNALVPLGWQVEVDAEPSRFVDFGNQVLDRRLAAGWDAAYVFLGTNYLGDQESYRKQLEKIVQRLAPAPVVLLTITLFADSRQQVNDAITLVAAEFPNVHVLDWGAMAATDPTTILRGDGHHLTNAGRALLAATVAGVLGNAPAQPGKCLSTSFTNDSGGSVNGSDKPSPKKVVPPTPTTAVKQSTPTTVTTIATVTSTTKPAGSTTSPTTTAGPTSTSQRTTTTTSPSNTFGGP